MNRKYYITLTILNILELSEDDVREMLFINDKEITEEDWNEAVKTYIENYIENEGINGVNDIEFEEAK